MKRTYQLDINQGSAISLPEVKHFAGQCASVGGREGVKFPKQA